MELITDWQYAKILTEILGCWICCNLKITDQTETSNLPKCVTGNYATYSNLTDMKRFPNSLSQIKTYNVGNTIQFG